jgi:tetratricopeptide (TPR) repeat protein
MALNIIIKNCSDMKTFKRIITVICLIFIAVTLTGTNVNDTARVNSYIRDGLKSLSMKGKIEEVKNNIDSAKLLIFRKHLDTPILLNLLMARYFFATSDFRGASDYASKTMEQAGEEGNDYVKTLVFLFYGDFYFRTGSFQESIDSYEKAIVIAKKEKYRGIITKALEGQSYVFNAMKDHESNGAYLRRLIDAAVAEKDTIYLTHGLYLLGTLHSERLRNFKLCDSLLRKCYSIASGSNDYNHMALSQANLGWNFYLAKMYDSSVVCYERSLKISVPYNFISASANAYGNLGTIYRDLGKPDKSIDYYNKSVEIAQKAGDLYNLQWVYLDISHLYLSLKDTSKAYVNFVMHKKYSDQYLMKTNAQGLSDARLRYDADSHRKEVEMLSLKIYNQKLLMYGSIGLAILVIAVSLLLYNGSRLKSRKRISEMNHTISELTQANLRQQMNPHFIFNTLNSIQYYMYQNDKIATNNYLTKFTSLMRKVLENSQHTSVTIRDELEALNLYLELESFRFKERFDYTISVDEEIDPMLFKIPTMLIQPYVENSICHGMMPGDSKGQLRIDLKLDNDHITCTIEDNGIGREAAQKKKMEKGGNHNSLGTRIVASRLDLVNSLYGTSLKTIYTDLKNESGEPAGTRVEIHIPILA